MNEMKARSRIFIGALAVLHVLLALTAASYAGWREDMGTFRIGMLADPGSSRMIAGLSEIRRAFSGALGMPVQIFVARDYAALIDAQATSRVEYAIYSTMAFATARRLCDCVEPLVVRQGVDFDTGIRSVLLVRKSILQAEAGIEAAKIALTQGDGIAGAIIPAMALSGTQAPRGITSEQLVIAASESDSESMLANGKVDGLFGWVKSNHGEEMPGLTGTMARLSQAGLAADSMDIYWRSGLIPYGPHAIRADVEDEAKDLLREFLTGLSQTKPDIQEFLAGSDALALVEISSDDYLLAYKIVDRLAGK